MSDRCNIDIYKQVGLLFEYDPNKSAANLAKHGIDFEDAQHLWDGPVLKVPTYAGTDEERIMVIGLIDGKHWSAITTTRGDRTRIISVRRSRKNEEAAYDGATGQGS